MHVGVRFLQALLETAVVDVDFADARAELAREYATERAEAWDAGEKSAAVVAKGTSDPQG